MRLKWYTGLLAGPLQEGASFTQKECYGYVNYFQTLIIKILMYAELLPVTAQKDLAGRLLDKEE